MILSEFDLQALKEENARTWTHTRRNNMNEKKNTCIFFSIIKLEPSFPDWQSMSYKHACMHARMMSSCMHGAPADASSRPPELPQASVCLVRFYCAVPAIIITLLTSATDVCCLVRYGARRSDDRLVLLCHGLFYFKKFYKIEIVVLSFIFDKYYLIID